MLDLLVISLLLFLLLNTTPPSCTEPPQIRQWRGQCDVFVIIFWPDQQGKTRVSIIVLLQATLDSSILAFSQ